MVEINLFAVFAAVIVMFVFGALWYTFPFQKAWARVHGFDKLSTKQQQALMKNMPTVYGGQLVVTIISAFVLTYFISQYPDVPYYQMAFFLWAGFVMPSQVSAVLFSRTDDKYKLSQIMIMTSEALIRMLVTAWVIALIVR